MRLRYLALFTAVLGLLSCTKQNPGDLATAQRIATDAPSPAALALPPSPGYTPPALASESNKILVDASRDGGVWWYPQHPGTGFDAGAPHQGKALADYLRSLGFVVDELPRGAEITGELLGQYDKVIRANAFNQYTPSELTAYNAFLDRPSALLLLQDHHKNTTNDNLSERLGLPFSGAQSGTITRFAPHDITRGVTSLYYVAGSVIPNPDPKKITVLGTLTASADSTASAAMGIVHHPSSRVFFLGDTNGLEQVPQPLTSNIVKWLFQ
ncbi:MAG TPA: hypothetical protein VGE66_01255 [Chitinophagaceae bacterium]